jgi:hypothetical protein
MKGLRKREGKSPLGRLRHGSKILNGILRKKDEVV